MELLPPEIVAGVFDQLPHEFCPFARAACRAWSHACPRARFHPPWLIVVRLASFGYLDCLRLIVQTGFLFTQYLPLCIRRAAAGDHLDCLRYLLDRYGPLLNVRHSALCAALKYGAKDTLQYLLSTFNNVDLYEAMNFYHPKLKWALIACARRGDWSMYFDTVHVFPNHSCDWRVQKAAYRQRNMDVCRRFALDNDHYLWFECHGDLETADFVLKATSQS